MTHVVQTAAEAVAGIEDGQTVLIGGFGNAGQPMELIDALLDSRASGLTVVNNNAGQADAGLALLIKERRVSRIICSFPRQSDSWHFDDAYRSGQIELELVPQGNLAERLRAAGAGIGAFFTPTGYGTDLARGKEVREIDGQHMVLEYPIHGDVALVKAFAADEFGNLVYRRTARNFGPVMAAAAARAVVQVEEIRSGALDPELVVTPGIYTDVVVEIPTASSRQGPLAGAPSAQEDPAQAGTPRALPPVAPGTPLTQDQLARRIAEDIPAGAYVNLGIGQPTSVSDFLSPSQQVTLHTENGMLGMGPRAEGARIDEDLINAGKIPVTELPGASYFHHADSFAMMRGGHLDVCVLGAYQVSSTGDLANWSTGRPGAIPAVGGAMDLAIGAKETYVMMDLFTRDGSVKIVPVCTFPLTGVGCVTRVYTRHGVFLPDPGGNVGVRELQGITMEDLRRAAPEVTFVPLS